MPRGARRTAATLVGLLLAALIALGLWPEAPAGPTGGWLKAAGLEPRFETVAGLRVRYVRAGEGPPVVLLHGFASSLYTWKDVLPALAGTRTAVALDFPGFGQSDQPPDLSADVYPGVVLGLMDRLGLGPVALVGNSMGGAVATLVAGRSPERVSALVLVDAAGFLEEGDRPWILRLANTAPGGAVFERLPVRRRMVRLSLRQVFHDPALVTEERFDEYLAPLQRPGATASILSLLASRAGDPGQVAAAAARVSVPTLVIWGKQDRWIPVEHADRFLAAIPGARKVVLDPCGHLPQEERPGDVVPLLREFLGGEE